MSDLRTLVIRRGGKNRRVALLSADAAVAKGLEANGCTVLVDPDGPDALNAFKPDVVVAFDGAVEGGAVFALLAQAAPDAELVFSCANSGAGSALVQQLLGRDAPQGQSEESLQRWLAEAGYRIVSRDHVVVPFVKTGLSADAEAALRALFEQVNPHAAAVRWLFVAKRGAPEVPAVPADPYVRFGDISELAIAALRNGTAAWAVVGPHQSLRAALLQGYSGFIVDRTRTGPFSLELAREAPAAEAMLFARLAAVFPPLFVHAPTATAQPIQGVLEALKARPLRMLVTLDELVGEAPLRHALADKVDAQLKARTPNLHRALKGLFDKP